MSLFLVTIGRIPVCIEWLRHPKGRPETETLTKGNCGQRYCARRYVCFFPFLSLHLCIFQLEKLVRGTDTDFQLKCDTVENYARSVPAQPKANDTIGSMVNADIFANATNKAKDELSVLFDFKAQVQQFINHEKNRKQLPAGLRQSDQWTVITILFGIWDLLAFSSLETMQAVETIDRSVAELMRNLDILVDHVEGPLKVVVPSVLDVTFLPRFFKRKNESSAMYAMDHHQAVFMWNHWNTALSKALVNWDRGDLSMPDLHGIVMDQVRNHQLYYNQISDADGFGTQAPLFHDVEQPCQMLNTSHTSDLQAAAVETCADPTRHLFW